MIVPKIQLAQTLLKLCEYNGISHIVISPGSRNAPLTIAFTNAKYFTCYSIVDERCAAFFALGIAQQLQQPVAVVCTSGSALLNYYPAIAEAYYSDIPLVVLSADRPSHLIGIGDGQTIEQKGVYGHHVLYEANLKADLREDVTYIEDEPTIIKSLENKLEKFLGLQESIEAYNSKEINKAFQTAITHKGPVHINVPFDEPLYDVEEKESIHADFTLPQHDFTFDEDFKSYQDLWYSSKRKMVLVGVNTPNKIKQKYLDKLANDDSVVVFTETTSNLHHDNFFASIDQIIAPLDDDGFKQLQPDIVLTFGGLVVSKKIKAFLRQYKPKHHWHVDTNKANDTFFCLDKHFKCTVNVFFERLFSSLKLPESNYFKTWAKIKSHRLKLHYAYVKEIPFSDFKVFDTVVKSLPNDIILQSANSSTIRYLQLFNLNKTVQVYCNRGTSGIDGSTSTAVGASVVSKVQTVFITGDLSFFYDSNALWNNYIPKNFRIILLNNQGGGIFRILPGHKNTDNFDTYFETKHNLTAKHLCDMYGFNYTKAENEDELNSHLIDFYAPSDAPRLLEIFTPRTINDEVLINYFKYIN